MNRTVLLDPADSVMLFLDHQNGLFQTVKDVPLAELRTNTVVLAKAAKLANKANAKHFGTTLRGHHDDHVRRGAPPTGSVG